MNTTNTLIQALVDESGATALEYGLLAALIAVGIAVAVMTTGSALFDLYAYWSATVIAAL